jgi:Aldo/keto reductase family
MASLLGEVTPALCHDRVTTARFPQRPGADDRTVAKRERMQAIPARQAGAPPALVLGAMNFGKRTAAKESERIVRRALERGIAYFDTANSYNAGESEKILGRALGRDRDRVVLSSKCGLGVNPGRP